MQPQWKKWTLPALLLMVVSGLLPTWASASAAPDFATLAEQLKPSVVNISTTRTVQFRRPSLPGMRGRPNDLFDEFFEHFFQGQPGRPSQRQSLGSGFVISADGYILTNDHVVRDADEITVRLADGRTFSAVLQGGDSKLDLALLKIDIDGEELPVASLGSSDALRVGEWVMAIGNPFGLAQTVTVGIVSAKGRVIGAGPYDDFIQTDASINPGNSGGPLFNTQGEVVGINTAIVAGGQGIGFAIPIDAARDVITQLRTTGQVVRGWLGVTIQSLTDELAASFGLDRARGALVTEVSSGSPADKAGIRRGDVIVAVNGHAVDEMSDLPRRVAALPVGQQARVTVIRDGKERHIQVKVAQLGAEIDAPSETPLKSLGLSLADPHADQLRRFGVEGIRGVLVTGVAGNSAAAAAAVRVGDLIVEANGQTTENLAALHRAVGKPASGASLRLLLRRGSRLFYTVIQVP